MDVVLIVLGILALPVWLAMGAIVIVVCVPVVVRAAGRVGTDSRGRVRVVWPAGVVTMDYRTPGDVIEVYVGPWRVYRGRETPAKPRTPKRRPGKPARADRAGRAGRVLAHWAALVRVFRRVWGSLQIRARARCVVGLPNPADTAMAAGVLCAVQGMLVLPVEVAADFDTQRFHVEGRLRARAWLAELGWIGVSEVLSTDMRTLIRGG